MLTVKKDAIKFRNSKGNMQSAGVLCNVGTFGVNLLDYVINWQYLFQTVDFVENTEININSKVCVGANVSNMFINVKNLKKIKLSATFSNYPITTNYMFANTSSIEEIDISNLNFQVYNAVSTFQSCSSLKKIIGVIDFSKAINVQGFFVNSEKLEEVRFKENSLSVSISLSSCSLLSDASIQNIIDGLADLTGQTAQTITFHKEIEAKLSDEQKAQITSKNWTLAFSK